MSAPLDHHSGMTDYALWLAHERELLQAEVERLRAVLERIATTPRYIDPDTRDIARRALEGE